jgi:DnaJ-class molecular chaperone
MAENYYILLGIPTKATQAEIKSAYRQKAKELHPDRCGGDRERFQDIQQAYEVLSDPARRQAYDAREACTGVPPAGASGARESRPRRRGVSPLWRQMFTDRQPESLRSASSPVEPLISGAPSERGREEWAPWSFVYQEVPFYSWSSRDSLGDQVYVEVSLSPEQARYGGRVEIRIPFQATCPACRGQGGRGFSMCARCAGRGWIEDQRPLLLSFPGAIFDGDVAQLSLANVGIPDVVLTVHFIVEEW